MSHPYDNLTPDAVIDAVESVGLLSDLRLIALNSFENRVYQVGIEDAQPIIAKFYRPNRWSDDQILEEHAFAQELADAELSVVAPLSINGNTLHHTRHFRMALFPRRGGFPPELDNLDNLLHLGRTLGRLHRVGASKTFRFREHLDIDERLTANRLYLTEHWIPRDLRPAWDTLTADLDVAVRAALEDYNESDQIRLHGDCHAGNILWRDEIAHIVDLDDCINGPAIQDLWMCLSGERHHRELQLAELIAGYEDFMDFDPRQLRWIEALRTTRMIRHSAWIAKRWDDPAFPKAFPWFEQPRYWSDQILALREQLAALQEPPLRLL
ncbi:MAG: serine/threonine protein kinase [Halieaceae bacterium]|jgi:Ser/Thr protein kinase RdoA (MazF antagonist)|nr:serine/threonine protein kinase [Halieaceae bacterium]